METKKDRQCVPESSTSDQDERLISPNSRPPVAESRLNYYDPVYGAIVHYSNMVTLSEKGCTWAGIKQGLQGAENVAQICAIVGAVDAGLGAGAGEAVESSPKPPGWDDSWQYREARRSIQASTGGIPRAENGTIMRLTNGTKTIGTIAHIPSGIIRAKYAFP